MSAAKIIVAVGSPASGKSTYAASLGGDIAVFSRDTEGGRIEDLMPGVLAALKEGKSVYLDNTNMTARLREPWLKLGFPCEAMYFKSSQEDCQIRALTRMWKKHGDIFWKGKAPDGIQDPGVFPPAVLFAARKNLEEPTLEEGFTKVTVVKTPLPAWPSEKNKALFLDIDGTLRATEHLSLKYPTSPDQVRLLKDATMMRTKLEGYLQQGYRLIGISNQSGIAKGTVSKEAVEAAFDKTMELLGIDIPVMYCPHSPVPINCYCRKPQVGMPLHAILKWKLDPRQCLMVGDRTTDKTTAARLGIPYVDAAVFWA